MMRLFLAVAVAAGLAQAHGWYFQPMDGSVWDVRVRREAFLSLSRKDTLIFEDGRLTVAGSAKKGMAPAGYLARRTDGQPQTWQATLQDVDGRTASWKGTIQGDRIEGVLVRSLADGKQKRYRFRGKRRI